MSQSIHEINRNFMSALDAYTIDLSIAKRYTVDLWVDRTPHEDGQHYRISFTANSTSDAAELCRQFPESVFWMVTLAKEEEVAP